MGWATLDELAAHARTFAGRHGARRMARLIRRLSSGARFEAERVAIRLLWAAGIRGWSVNSPICDALGLIGVGDIVFEALRLVVEIDGWAFHITPDRFQRDRDRQNRLVAAGWTVLRFTWRDLTERPEYVIATIRAMLVRLDAAAS